MCNADDMIVTATHTFTRGDLENNIKHELQPMSSRKRSADGTPSPSSKKRKVTISTFNKKKTQFECDHNTLSWLCWDVSIEDKTVVKTLWCKACRKHKDKITGVKNFSEVQITGSSN